MNKSHETGSPGRDEQRLRWGMYAAIGILGYFLISEHQAHAIQFLPYLLLIACPLIHVFMHRGHGHHHSGGSDNNAQAGHKEAHHE